MLTEKELQERLLDEWDYPTHLVENTARRLMNMSPQVTEAFETWCETGRMPQLEAEGYSLEQLRRDFRMKPVGAFLTLDWLVKEPQEAREALRQGIR